MSSTKPQPIICTCINHRITMYACHCKKKSVFQYVCGAVTSWFIKTSVCSLWTKKANSII